MSTRYCGTTRPVKAPVPTARSWAPATAPPRPTCSACIRRAQRAVVAQERRRDVPREVRAPPVGVRAVGPRLRTDPGDLVVRRTRRTGVDLTGQPVSGVVAGLLLDHLGLAHLHGVELGVERAL